MSEALERLRAANRYEMKLENGIPITYRLPFMRELVIAGLLPLTLLDELRDRMKAGLSESEAEAIAEQDMQTRLADYEKDFEAQKRVVALMVESIENEPVTLEPDDTLEIPQGDFAALINAATSRTPVRAEGEV